MTTTETKESNLEIMESVLYGHTEKIVRRFSNRLLFTEGGFGRLLSIFGWIVGIKQAGNAELANCLADSIMNRLNYLSPLDSAATFSWKIEGEADQTVEVPASRVVLYDDGSFNSFAVCWYHPVDPNFFEQLKSQKLKADPELDSWSAKNQVDKDLNITRKQDRVVNLDNDLTVTRYFPGPIAVEVPYKFSYNGGLIYHGPAAGQTFTVSLSSCLWGIHT